MLDFNLYGRARVKNNCMYHTYANPEDKTQIRCFLTRGTSMFPIWEDSANDWEVAREICNMHYEIKFDNCVSL